MGECAARHGNALDETVCSILRGCRRIAVVGCSDKPWRDSFVVARYLIDHGYTVLPVNPEIGETLGLRSYPDLKSAPGPIEVVDIFRSREHIPEVVTAAIEIGARAVWMQSGLEDEASAAQARRAGLQVVMNRCIKVEHIRHLG